MALSMILKIHDSILKILNSIYKMILTHHYSKIFLYTLTPNLKNHLLNSIILDDSEKLTLIPLSKSYKSVSR